MDIERNQQKKCKECGTKIIPAWTYCDEAFCRGKRELRAYNKRYIPKKKIPVKG